MLEKFRNPQTEKEAVLKTNCDPGELKFVLTSKKMLD